MLTFEQAAWKRGVSRLAGVDEAGRGSWAGPLVVAAVYFNPAFLQREAQGSLAKLTDSKRLSAKQREHFYELLTDSENAICSPAIISVAQVDDMNILAATHLAMRQALAKMNPPPDFALIDGLPVPGLPCPAQSLVNGDSRSLSIAAASVVAKVTRDRLMVELDSLHPGYGFAGHKGYGTSAHRAALLRLGVSSAHRRSFRPVRDILDPPWFT